MNMDILVCTEVEESGETDCNLSGLRWWAATELTGLAWRRVYTFETKEDVNGDLVEKLGDDCVHRLE